MLLSGCLLALYGSTMSFLALCGSPMQSTSTGSSGNLANKRGAGFEHAQKFETHHSGAEQQFIGGLGALGT